MSSIQSKTRSSSPKSKKGVPVPLSYSIKQENVEKFLNAIDNINVRKTIKLLIQNTKHVSYDEFLNQIQTNIPDIIKMIPKNRPIFAYVDSKMSEYFGKSNFWMFMLVKNSFKIEGRTIKLVYSLDDDKIQNDDLVMIIDDCVYSGIQMSKSIAIMQNATNKKLNILIFVPYMSKNGMALIKEAFKKNKQLASCTLTELDNYKMIVPFGCYIDTQQATEMSHYYPHLKPKEILEAYLIYFDHKVAKYISSFPAVYSGIVPNKHNASIIRIMAKAKDTLDMEEFWLFSWESASDDMDKIALLQFNDPDTAKESIARANRQLQINEKKLQIIPLLNNCEKNLGVDLYESSCPVPPYKMNNKSNSFLSVPMRSVSKPASFHSLQK